VPKCDQARIIKVLNILAQEGLSARRALSIKEILVEADAFLKKYGLKNKGM